MDRFADLEFDIPEDDYYYWVMGLLEFTMSLKIGGITRKFKLVEIK